MVKDIVKCFARNGERKKFRILVLRFSSDEFLLHLVIEDFKFRYSEAAKNFFIVRKNP